MMVVVTSIFLEIVSKPDYMQVGKTVSGGWWTAEGAQEIGTNQVRELTPPTWQDLSPT